MDRMADSVERYRNWMRQNPKQTTAYVVAGVAVAAPMVIAGPILGALGFGATGIAAGSVAAGAQTANVAAGSLFAILQSAGMGGYGVATVGGIVQGGGIISAILTALRSNTLDRRRLNPIENIWGSPNDYGDDDADEDDSDSNPTSKYDFLKAANRVWAGFVVEKLISIMNMMPQLIERLKEMKDSMLGY
ncbi:hypothetical protein GL218_00454 [Daldinia childiae]|uniref:uncharacterized protein n=1 Tax=Daldinia childiae TaxID=326645 RepID=UPI001445D517|nr:uncharacterized protein GL218_00454 [Daldinia childiae]KAF3071306.1 hypothetical protein GL218_00454 [Daldinia childiae]